MKVKDLKIKLEFTDKNGEKIVLNLDQFDHLEYSQDFGFIHASDPKFPMALIPEQNGQIRMNLRAWTGMEKYEDLKQG